MTTTEKEAIIQGYIKNLEISREEAEQLFIDDYSDNILPEVAEIEKKVKKNGRMYVATDKKHAPVKKERKIDTKKKELLNLFKLALPKEATNIEVYNEVSLSFKWQDENYTLKLTRHKKNK